MGADLAPCAPAVRGAARARLRCLCAQPAGRAAPFTRLALLRAEARSAEAALAFLREAAALAADAAQALGVQLYPPVPPPVSRVADVERLQMLVESASRSALQQLLALWLPQLQALRAGHRAVLRWAVDVDPLGI